MYSWAGWLLYRDLRVAGIRWLSLITAGLKHIAAIGGKPERLDAIPAVEKLVERAVHVGAMPDRYGRRTIQANHRFVVPVRHDGELKRAWLTVRETPEGRNIYDVDIEGLGDVAGPPREGAEAPLARAVYEPPSKVSIDQVLPEIKSGPDLAPEQGELWHDLASQRKPSANQGQPLIKCASATDIPAPSPAPVTPPRPQPRASRPSRAPSRTRTPPPLVTPDTPASTTPRIPVVRLRNTCPPACTDR